MTTHAKKNRLTSEDLKFMGAVHEAALAEIGTNHEGERVVRIAIGYLRGTAPSTSITILTVEAARELRDALAVALR